MKVMISQPMNGKTDEEIQVEKTKIIEKLEKLHIEVVNSLFDKEAPNDINAGLYYMSKAIKVMASVDAVYFAKDWQTARGCRIERLIAEEYGIKVLDTNVLENEEKTKDLNDGEKLNV